MPVPETADHLMALKVIYQHIIHGQAIKYLSTNEYKAQNEPIEIYIKHNLSPSAQVYDLTAIFCKEHCEIQCHNKVPLYVDSDHLSPSGSHLLDPIFAAIFAS